MTTYVEQDPYLFFRKLYEEYDSLWVATFTVGRPPLRLPVSRLIYAKKLPEANMSGYVKTKWLYATHVKLYIGLRRRKPSKAFTGSLNLVDSSADEVMVSMPVRAAVEIFEQLWMIAT